MQQVYVVRFGLGGVLGVFDTLAAAHNSILLSYSGALDRLTQHETDGKHYSRYFDTERGEAVIAESFGVRASVEHL